jgi:hypothetical protein
MILTIGIGLILIGNITLVIGAIIENRYCLSMIYVGAFTINLMTIMIAKGWR